MMKLQKRIWIAWERQRRSIELAKKLGCDLFIIEYEGITRYPRSIFKTISILKYTKPDILFVQNPSMILATFACICKLILKYPVVVDRHTTFRLNKKDTITPYNIIHKLLHRFTIRYADLTIVTNKSLANLIDQLRGKPFVLPDSIPALEKTKIIKLKGKHNILLISSFADDEPIEEVIEAVKYLNMKDIYLYITGNHKKFNNPILHSTPSNVIFTGFLEEQKFVNMLFSVDTVMVLTTADCCILCGCYEAVSASKPLITSSKEVLMEYFKGVCFVDNTIKGISAGISEVLEHLDYYRDNTYILKTRLIIQWNEWFDNLEKQLYTLTNKKK